MSTKKLYALTDEHVEALKAWAEYGLSISTDHKELDETADASHALTPLDTDAAVERMARAWACLDPGEPWPTNEELGGGLTGTRDDEYRHECMDRARAALDALLGGGQA